MVEIRVAGPTDVDGLSRVDHLVRRDLEPVVRRGHVLLARDADTVVGWLRWGLFWDEVPFMNLLRVVDERRGQGLGRRLVEEWESAARADGRALVMTSTLADQSAQHFYRHLGYTDSGCLLLPGEAAELFFTKSLG